MAKTRRSTNKDIAAKQKVENLLKDTILKEEKPKDALETATKEKETDYLVETVAKLTEENERLQQELEKSFKDIEKFRNAPDAPVDVEEVKAGVRKLFVDLENAHLGRNPERRMYPDANIKILLDKFLGTFPFLMNK